MVQPKEMVHCFTVCGMIMSCFRSKLYRVSKTAFTLHRFQVNTDHTVENAPEIAVYLQQLCYRFGKKKQTNKQTKKQGSEKRRTGLKENIFLFLGSSQHLCGMLKDKEQRRAKGE